MTTVDMIAPMIAAAAAATRFWEQGDELGYRGLAHPDLQMRIPSAGVELTGLDTIWNLRKLGGERPLAIHSQHSAYVTGSTVVALSTIYSRETGAPTQHAECKYTFGIGGKIVFYEQEILWRA